MSERSLSALDRGKLLYQSNKGIAPTRAQEPKSLIALRKVTRGAKPNAGAALLASDIMRGGVLDQTRLNMVSAQ